jgi:hypothetical protein
MRMYVCIACVGVWQRALTAARRRRFAPGIRRKGEAVLLLNASILKFGSKWRRCGHRRAHAASKLLSPAAAAAVHSFKLPATVAARGHVFVLIDASPVV